jgi:hypothetical protein
MSTPLQIRKAVRRAAFLKLALTGVAGSGKTFSALRMATGLANGGPILLGDTENRSADLYAQQFEFDKVDIEPPFTWDKFTDFMKAAIENGYSVAIIDSASHFWEGVLEYKSQLDNRGGNSFTNWNQAGEKFKAGLNAVLQAPVHVIACLRSKTEYVLEQNDKGRQTPRKVGLAPVFREGADYEFTTVLDIALDHTAKATKDRTQLFGDAIFQITEETGQRLLTWLGGSTIPPAATATATGGAVQDRGVHEAAPQAVFKNATQEQIEKLTLYAQNSIGAPLVQAALDKAGQVSVAELTEEQADKTIGWIQQKMNEAAPQPPKAPAADITQWLTGYTAEINEYLVKVKWIQPGQSWKDLSEEKMRSIRERTDRFARAVGIPTP